MATLVAATLLACGGAAFPQAFVTPIGGTPFEDWTIVNYTDLDTASGPVLDWNGGNYTYDGHDAIDYTLPNFAAMDAGVPVLAAAAGTVIATRDGEYDRWSRVNPTPAGALANSVEILHANDIVTRYLHLRRGSVAVAVGDTVSAGQRIGLVGSSGRSTDAHLHFGVYDVGTPSAPVTVETYQDPEYWWQDPLAYPADRPGASDSGITDHDPDTAELVERPLGRAVFDLQDGSGQRVHAWAQVHGFDDGDTVEYTFREPDGDEYRHYTWTSGQIRYGWWEANAILPDDAELGTWTVEGRVNGELFARNTFEVRDGVPQPPAAATLLTPDGAVGDANPVYTWNAVPGATWYRLWVADELGTPVTSWYRDSEVGCVGGGGTCSVQGGATIAGNAHWWIRTWNGAGLGPWSVRKDFTGGPLSTPAAPTPSTPSGVGAGGTPVYSWNAVPETSWYFLHVDDATGAPIRSWFRKDDIGCGDGVGTCAVQPATAITGDARWWVLGWNSGGHGPWSAGTAFTP